MELLRPSSVEELGGGICLHGGTEVVPLLRDGILHGDRLVDVREVVPRGVHGNVIGAGTTLAELEAARTARDRSREAAALGEPLRSGAGRNGGATARPRAGARAMAFWQPQDSHSYQLAPHSRWRRIGPLQIEQ